MTDHICTDCRHISDRYDRWDGTRRHWYCGRFNSRIAAHGITCRGCDQYEPSDAATALEQAEAEREGLRQTLETTTNTMLAMRQQREEQRERAEMAEAERDRLREEVATTHTTIDQRTSTGGTDEF